MNSQTKKTTSPAKTAGLVIERDEAAELRAGNKGHWEYETDSSGQRRAVWVDDGVLS
jgi:hypothetical protein